MVFRFILSLEKSFEFKIETICFKKINFCFLMIQATFCRILSLSSNIFAEYYLYGNEYAFRFTANDIGNFGSLFLHFTKIDFQ